MIHNFSVINGENAFTFEFLSNLYKFIIVCLKQKFSVKYDFRGC